jgi:hypothetical protein
MVWLPTLKGQGIEIGIRQLENVVLDTLNNMSLNIRCFPVGFGETSLSAPPIVVDPLEYRTIYRILRR